MEYLPEQKLKHQLNIVNKESGFYTIRFSDEQGQPIKEFQLGELKVGSYSVKINEPQVQKGLYYVELRRNGKLCHFLEWRIE